MNRLKTYLLPLALGFAVGLTGLVTWSVVAEDTELDSGPRVFPYEGVIDLDGTPFEGDLDVRVTLTTLGEETWSETHPQVAVSPGGRFGLQIGERSGGVPAWVFDTEQVFISLAMRGAGQDSPHVALAGRQRIRPVPFAYWAAEGNELDVHGELFVEGSVHVAGTTTTQRMSLGDNARDINLASPLALAPGAGLGMEVGNTTVRHELRDGRPALVLRTPASGVHRLQAGGQELLTVSEEGAYLPHGLTIPYGVELDVNGGFTVVPHQEFSNPNRNRCFMPDLQPNRRYFAAEPGQYQLDGPANMSLGTATRRFCALMDFYTEKEEAENGCRLVVQNGEWVLTSNADANCDAACARW